MKTIKIDTTKNKKITNQKSPTPSRTQIIDTTIAIDQTTNDFKNALLVVSILVNMTTLITYLVLQAYGIIG